VILFGNYMLHNTFTYGILLVLTII
jgi:hypothetical protein